MAQIIRATSLEFSIPAVKTILLHSTLAAECVFQKHRRIRTDHGFSHHNFIHTKHTKQAMQIFIAGWWDWTVGTTINTIEVDARIHWSLMGKIWVIIGSCSSLRFNHQSLVTETSTADSCNCLRWKRQDRNFLYQITINGDRLDNFNC